MAVTSFIPKLWEARLLAHLDKAHVATAFVNRDYEGEIKQKGDTVHVNQLGDITVRDYTPGTAITVEDLVTTDQTLVIDQDKYWAFKVEDLDKVQVAGPMVDEAMSRAAYKTVDKVDTDIFAEIAGAAKAANTIGTAANKIALTVQNVYSNILKLKTKLDNANVVTVGRKLAITPDIEALLLEDDRFVKAGVQESEDRLENGYVGRVAGFDVYITLNLPANTVIATVPSATSFAEQLVSTEALRSETAFADIVRGHDVYGVKTFQADAVAKLLYTI